jgi:hypothetical protein
VGHFAVVAIVAGLLPGGVALAVGGGGGRDLHGGVHFVEAVLDGAGVNAAVGLRVVVERAQVPLASEGAGGRAAERGRQREREGGREGRREREREKEREAERKREGGKEGEIDRDR